MKLKLQPFEKKFLEELTNRLGSVADADAEALFRAWRWHFGGGVEKDKALRLPDKIKKDIDFFQKSPDRFCLFIQNGNVCQKLEEIDPNQTFMAWKYSGFCTQRGAPIYFLYSCL